MLPSTGYFKGINCPFYDNGLCERPYCHFRHVKKEPQNVASDTIESDEILQKLVSAAVQKVLKQSEASGTTTTQSGTVDTSVEINKITNVDLPSKATYNPTPISELNKINNTDTENEEINEQRKRHIPVPYTPRKPASLPIKRPLDTNGSSKPFIYIPPAAKYTPGSTDMAKVDLYTPKGGVESTEKYLPGTEKELQKYNPNQNQKNQISSNLNYIPSDKAIVKKKVLEYKPKLTAKTKVSSVTYQPTPRSLAPCFSSDEEEPCVKKRKVSNDFNGLDDLGPEFDILDQILDEEKPGQGVSNITKVDEFDSKKNDDKKEEKSRDRTEKTSNKIDTDIKEKSEACNKEKHNSKSRNSHKKSSHKPSSGSKHKAQEESKVKHNEKHKHSSSKSSERHSENSSSTNSNKHTKHSKSSSSSKRELKNKDKSKHQKSHKSSRESKERYKSSKNKKSSSNKVSRDHTDQDSSIQNEEFEGSDLYDISDSDEETRALECKRIFEEYVPTEKITTTEETVTKDEDTQDNEYVPTKKRISRTVDKNIKIIPRKPAKPDYKVSAAQTMSERLTKVKEYHASKDITNSSNRTLISTTDLPKNTGNSKIRIAHVPYASTLINAKKNISNCNVTKSEASTSSTVTQTIKKGTQRVAHIPNEKFIDRPGVLEPLASKIPANIRSTYLNMMIDESLKIYLSASDAYARAQHEELTTSKKCTTIQIYKNSAVLAVSRLRKEAQECNGVKKSGADCSTLQKIPQTTSGKTSNNGSWSIECKNRSNAINIQEFSGAKLYNNIHKWVLTEEQLHNNGFPRLHPAGEKGRAIIYGQNKQRPPKGYIRTCCRCKKEYTVDKKGFPAVKEECIYHPNNKYRVRGEARYQCCSQDGTSDGCCIASSHVYEYVDYENLKGYVRTLPPETKSDDYGVYSLDCEMCYTTQGLDLTRVTVINSTCKVIYETLVKPLHPIIDYNTRYSGITEEQMAKVKTTLLEVQATLLAMFNSKTILIGHSLESDFKALKLIHDTVIDTSVLFPHKMGPPYKRALRNLSSEYLKKIIQNSVEGHDSAEDATVCMELIHYKLKEDLKTRSTFSLRMHPVLLIQVCVRP